MEFAEYARKSGEFAVYPVSVEKEYLILSIIGEMGEVAQVFSKAIRSGKPVEKIRLLDELGDVVWYLTRAITAPSMSPIPHKSITPDDFERKIRYEVDYRVLPNQPATIDNLDEKILALVINIQTLASRLVESEGFVGYDRYKAISEAMFKRIMQLVAKLGYTMSDLYEYNIAKLTQRKSSKEGK